MIIWLNGTFGVGKTTTGALLAERDVGLRTFDPEWVGYLLRVHLADTEVADVQAYPSWRRRTPVVADEIVRVTRQHLVAVQTVLVEDYWHELVAGLAALGHEVVHVVLEAQEPVMRARIESDQVDRGFDPDDKKRRPHRRAAGHRGGTARNDDHMQQHEPPERSERESRQTCAASAASAGVVAKKRQKVARGQRYYRCGREPAATDLLQ